MKTIKIIDVLHLDNDGVKSKMKNGKLQLVHLRQGDLDGACAVYSTMMILILIGAVKYKDIKLFGNSYDKRYGIERLKKELLETKGLHRDGNFFFHEEYDNIKDMLQRSFSKTVSSKHIDYLDNKIVETLKKQIDANQPILFSIAFKGGGNHALVAIGMEYDEKNEPTKILCLDPGYATPKFTYWNSVIDLKPFTGKYNFRNITETGICQYVQLQDVLIITKK
jgi:hypothetical protein